MAISLVAGANSATTTISKPAGTAQGDLMVMCMLSDNASTAPTPPAGWTALDAEADSAGGNGQQFASAWKVAGASEPASYTFTGGTGSIFDGGAIVTLRGQDATTPIDAHGKGGTGAVTGTAFTIAALTASIAGDELVIFSASFNGNAVTTWPTGVTEYAPASNPASNDIDTGTKSVAGSGSTGSLTVTYGGTAQVLSGLAVLVKAPGGGSTVSGSATEQANAVIAESAQLVASATEQANSVVAATPANILATAIEQANSQIAEAAQLVANSAPVQANSGLTAHATIIEPAAPIEQANAVLAAPSAQVVDPSAIVQANSVLTANGNIAGSGNVTFQANAALTVTGARVIAPSAPAMQANAALVASLAIVLVGALAMQANSVLAAAGGVLGQKIVGDVDLANVALHAVTLATTAVAQVTLANVALHAVTLANTETDPPGGS